MFFEKHPVLSKGKMTLHVLDSEYENELASLAADQEIWKYTSYQYENPAVFKEKWIAQAHKQIKDRERVCHVIFYDGKMVGSSSYYEIDLSNKKTNVGYTWFHPSVWGSSINALSKLILLEYAFETLRLNRVGFSVDSHNERSCRSLEKYGMKREGVLRNHLVLPNRIRDSVIFSVINTEWEIVKNGLIKIVGTL